MSQFKSTLSVKVSNFNIRTLNLFNSELLTSSSSKFLKFILSKFRLTSIKSLSRRPLQGVSKLTRIRKIHQNKNGRPQA
jgi:hypothetical protein